MKPPNGPTVKLEEMERFAAHCLVAAGAPAAEARITAAFLTRTDAFGIHSHGLRNLEPYIEKSRRGALDLTARPSIDVEGSAFALLDARDAIGMVSGAVAMDYAVDKASRSGIAIVIVRRSTHFGAAGLYSLLAAERGLIGITASNVDPNMAIPGARGKSLGNNPIAYALPAQRHRPVIFDIALSAVASLKVVDARDRGEDVPLGWIVDDAGRPTTDPSRYPDEGAMVPMAEHKGYGLALLVDALTGLLADAPTSDQVPSWLFDLDRPNDVSQVFLAIDPAVFGARAPYSSRLDEYLDRIHALPLAAGARETLYPGEVEWRRHDFATEHGVCLPADVLSSLEMVGRSTGVVPPWN